MNYIKDACNCDLELKEVHWRWFPVPHLEISDISISTDKFSAHIKRADINPAVFNTLNGNPGIDNITCLHPSLRIKSLTASEEGLSLPDIPVKFIIREGVFSTSSMQCGHGLECRAKVNLFSHINGSITVRHDRVGGDVSFSSDYADQLRISGSFMPESGTYTMRLKVEKGRFENIFKELSGYQSHKFALSSFNLEMQAGGKIHGDFQAAVQAESPCMFDRSAGLSPLISCGAVKLDAERRGKDLFVNIREFDSMAPEFSLAGHVSAHSLFSKERIKWDIDLAARDIDLSAVREKLLAVFGDNENVKEVCDIVRGGRAPEAGYSFHGYTDDFQHISSMLITAVAENVPVMIPDINLFLSSASGRIRIEDGVLHGWDMDGIIEKSTASNGRITVGIDDDAYQLVVDFDIDADLPELYEILGRIVPDQDFQDELAEIHDVTGNARGHLYLGDDFRDFHVDVDIDDVKGALFYTRLNIPVRLDGGGLEIRVGEESVKWKDIRGVAGNSRVLSSSGSVNWKDAAGLDIKEMQAEVDTEQLFNLLMGYPMFHERLASFLSLMSGPLYLDEFSLKGAVGQSESFHLSFDGRLDGMRVVSPLLPGRVVAKTGRIKGDEQHLELKDINMTFAKDHAVISADLRHRWFSDFKGMIELSTEIDALLSGWIKKHNWIPDTFYPAVPCYADRLKIEIEDEKEAVSGRIFFPDRKSPYSVFFSMMKSEDLFDVDRLELHGPWSDASFSCAYKGGKTGFFRADYKGLLSADTLDRLLEDNRFINGTIRGDLSLSAAYGRDITCTGDLKIDDLRIPWVNGTSMSVNRLNIDANGTDLNIKRLQVENMGETVDLKGRAHFTPGAVGLDVNATADNLHYTYGEGSYSGTLSGGYHGPKHGDNTTIPENFKLFGMKLFGKGQMHLKKFVYNIPVSVLDKSAANEVDSYILSDIKGYGEINMDGTMSGNVTNTSMCGFDMRISFHGEDGNSTLIVTGNTEHEIMFDSLMPCLNLSEKLIEGPLKLDVRMVRKNGHWLDGRIRFDAHDGRLLRMKLLSKILSVVNMLDLFTPSGWKDLTANGLAFEELTSESHIENDTIVIDKLILDGSGINIFGSGSIMMDPPVYDIVLGISPLKTVDTILTNVPLFGKALGGKQGSFVVIPVALKGPVSDPEIKSMPADTVTGVMKRIFDTITTPVTIFVPDSPDKAGKRGGQEGKK